MRIASLAGAPTVTLTDKANTSSGDWGDDGYIYFEVDSGVARMRATGGEIEPVYTISPERKEIATEWVHVLPGGTGVLFRLRHTGQGPGDFEIMAAPLPPRGEARSLVRGVYALYAPTGHLLVITADGKLIAIPFDPKKLELTGAPVALIEGIGVRNGGFNIDLTLAGNGTSGLHHGRHARLPARGVGEPGGRGERGGSDVGPTGRHRIGPPLPRREVGGRGVVARGSARHLGQAAPRGPLLADHLRGHLERAALLVARRPRCPLRRATDPVPASGRPMRAGRTEPGSRAC